MPRTTRTALLVSLAHLMGLTVSGAIALPTVVEVSARKVGMSEAEMLRELVLNKPLRDYLAGVCNTTEV